MPGISLSTHKGLGPFLHSPRGELPTLLRSTSEADAIKLKKDEVEVEAAPATDASHEQNGDAHLRPKHVATIAPWLGTITPGAVLMGILIIL